ncbi:hypothetical protein DJ71_24895 [Halorubrum sp. E3]|nr:hypothetical protein DJ71_24895 [Halorubrum sp. E3]
MIGGVTLTAAAAIVALVTAAALVAIGVFAGYPIATAFTESLSAAEVEELSTTLEDNGTEIVEALDLVLELQRGGQLEELVDLANTLSALEIDEDTAEGLNNLLAAVGEAQRISERVGVLGLLRELRSRDARDGLGSLVEFLKAQGRGLRR